MPKAVTYDRTGGPDVLAVTDVAMPEPGAGEVRIKVAAASANLLDAKLRRGDLPWPQPYPVVPGLDAAGVVDALGADVVDVAVGDAVFGAGQSTYADGARDPHGLVCHARRPGHGNRGSYREHGETAFRALAHLALAPGQTLLIHGAAGGVGAIAVQLAVKQGVTVIAAVGPKDSGKLILMPSPRPHSDIPATFAALQRRPPTATTASSSP